ncbi:radical SAM protein [Candidatus Poribacteria bacterium]|nr:radical SAM protein [Candidatus Poribacteria bacterium]
MSITTSHPNFASNVPSINYHLWEPCNMRCGFCFATFQDVKREMDLPKGHLPEEECISVVDQIAEFGFEKINFAGGEPTLCPWLPDLIVRAKAHGMTTSIVTNGSGITDPWLDTLNGRLDWVGLSIDTVDREKLIRLGRAGGGNSPITEAEYLDIIRAIKQHGIRLKINTVVTAVTWQEDFIAFIRLAKPERWKLLQALAVKGQNDASIADFTVATEEFEAYFQRNCIVEDDGIRVIPESNRAMTESYVMIDPAGRFFDNAQDSYRYSDPILRVGVAEALKQVSIDPKRFRQRGGHYDW